MMPSTTEDEADAASTRRGGINENYARELMELHTLGVHGAITKKTCRSGTMLHRLEHRPADAASFSSSVHAHDNGAKIVLGQRIAAGGGMQDGERVLGILATHPSTARFLAHKLCMRLVSDEPPTAIIEARRAGVSQERWRLACASGSIVQSKEFWSPSAYRSKIKSPFGYAVSAIRAVGGTLTCPIGAASGTHGARRHWFRFSQVELGTCARADVAGVHSRMKSPRWGSHCIRFKRPPLS
jgi:uncharacterized protein (DUF1800 family)